MKHRLSKILVVITFFIIFMPMHPMDMNQNKLFLTRTKKLLAYLGAFQMAFTSSVCVHELGHAAVATALCPGIVREINIGWLSGEVTLKSRVFKGEGVKSAIKRSSRCFTAIYFAEPAIGILYNYAAIKGLRVFDEYRKTKNLKQAVEQARNKPILMSLYDPSFLHGLQAGMLCSSYLNILALTAQKGGESDGSLICSNILKDIRMVRWPLNIALVGGLLFVHFKMIKSYLIKKDEKEDENINRRKRNINL